MTGHSTLVQILNQHNAANFEYDDHGRHWELAEKNGFYSPFDYAA